MVLAAYMEGASNQAIVIEVVCIVSSMDVKVLSFGACTR
jgi:hypothetical protein